MGLSASSDSGNNLISDTSVNSVDDTIEVVRELDLSSVDERDGISESSPCVSDESIGV